METSERNIEANMNELIGRIEAKYEKMSKGQKRLAEYVKENYDKAVFLTAARLGEIVGVSESTVVRFATQLGYRGYPEFQKALEELVRNKLNSIQRMEVTYGRITQSEILETVLQSDIEKIKMTLSAIDHKAFNWAIDTLLEAKRIYVVGIRSCAPLASFMGFYLNLVCDNVITVNTNSSSEIFEQIIRIGEGDVIIGISFPRYSMRTLKALEFASNRKEELVRNKLNSIQRMEVTYGRITQSEILETVLQSDIEKIKMTLSAIDHKAFNWAIDTLLEAKRIYVVGIRSCAPLASFMGFYLNLVCDNVITVNTNSSSEIFEQIIRIGEGDVIIGISFPRYSMRTLKALEFASNRKAKVITLTDSIHSPMNQYSSCNLIARSDMASIVDSLVAPLSVINALIVAICMKKQKEVVSTLETLEKIWGEYQVYSGEESSQEGGSAGTNESYRQNKGEE